MVDIESNNNHRFEELLREVTELYKKKAADYGHEDGLGNLHEVRKMGVEPWRGCLVRMSDKMARLYNFARKGTLKNESFRDSAIDLAVYSLLLVILWEEEQNEGRQGGESGL